MKLSFHHRVQGEVNEAIDWYEEQANQLGDDFFRKLMHTLERIRAHPEGYSFWLASNKVRRAKLQRFPYDVLYEIKSDRVRVLCVRHEKRHPSFGMGRQ